MKRAAIGVLILSLVTLPAFAGGAGSHNMPLSKAHCMTLEHIPGAWRMVIACDQGDGSIVLSDATQQYFGEGMFAGWSQEQMRALYRSLIPKDDSHFEIAQLG